MRSLQHKTLSRLFSLALMAGVIAGLTAARARAVAQTENPNVPVKPEPAASGQATLPAQPGQVKKEEAEEENVYRHTPLVASISDAVFRDNANAPEPEKVELRAKHIEITARTFEWVNTLIILLAIVLPISRILPKVLRTRAQTLKTNLETARKNTADANARLSAVEAQLARLDDEIGKIRSQVEAESKQDEARVKASIEEESARIIASAEQEIAAAAAHAQRGLKAFAADLAIEQAAKQLILTPETDRELIAEFVASATNTANSAKTGGRS